jgi:hypothetical protein
MKGKITKGRIPATKKRPTPKNVYSFFLSIIPEAMSSTAKNPITGGSICENIRYALASAFVTLDHL